MLRFADGTFSRGSSSVEWMETIQSAKRYASGSAVIVRRNGRRYLRACGPFENYCLQTEALATSPWAATAASVAANTATAPDGSATADVLTLNNDVAAVLSQDLSILTDSAVHDFTFWYRRNGGTDQTFRARITSRDASTTIVDFTATSEWQRGRVSAASLAGATPFSVALIQVASPAGSSVIDVWGCQVTLSGSDSHIYSGQNIPYFRRTDSFSSSTSARDEMAFDVADVPRQIFSGAFAISFIPLFASSAIAAAPGVYDYILSIAVDADGDNPRTAGLRLTSAGGACVLEWCGDDGAVACSRPLTFSALQEITATLDASAGTLTVTGATTGNGTATASAAWSVTPSDIVIGGGDHLVLGGGDVSGIAVVHVLSSSTLDDIAFNPAGNVGLGVSAGAGVTLRSVVDGTWSEADYTATVTASLKRIAWWSDTEAVAIGGNGSGDAVILRTSNAGAAWSLTATDLTAVDAAAASIHVVAKTATALVAVFDDGAGNFRSLRSTNGGASWILGGTFAETAALFSATYDATSGRIFVPLPGYGVAYSADNGASWVTVATPGTGTFGMTQIARGVDLIGVGFDDFGGTPAQAVWRSVDNGDNWTLETPTGMGAIADQIPVSILAMNAGRLVGGCSCLSSPVDALFESFDDGLTWNAIVDTVPLSAAGGVNPIAVIGNDRFQIGNNTQIAASSVVPAASATPTSAFAYVSEPRVVA